MHYYQFNIGNYRRRTHHLSLLEHGIYRQLIDTYYLSESPLTLDESDLMRTHCIRSEEEAQALKNILKDFFILTDKGYIHPDCDDKIAAYQAKSTKAAASAKARWDKEKQQFTNDCDAKAMRTHSEGNANHKPITNNQEPIKDIHSPSPIGDERDPVPYEKIRELYNKSLPELRECKQLSSKRKSQIRRRWKDGMPNLETWTEFFMYVRQSDFLMGKAPPTQGRKQFEADLEWLTNESNFLKIYEGKYHG